MELNKLYYFHTVAKHQHVTKAAEELHIAQPALTKAVKLLEADLGVPLFYRDKRNIYLTEYGKHLKLRLDEVFSLLDKIPEEFAIINGEKNRTIRLNVLAASTVVTEAIVEYKKKNSDAVFQVIQNEEETDCDISVTTETIDFSKLPTFDHKCIFNEKIFLAVPKSDPFDKEWIDLKDIRDRGFVNLAGSRSFRSICDRFCSSAGFEPKTVFESDSVMAVRNLIGIGAGVGFWPAFSWGEVSEDIKLIPVNFPCCERQIFVGLHNSATPSESAHEFYHFMINFIKNKQADSEL